jgi:hypothetical protein
MAKIIPREPSPFYYVGFLPVQSGESIPEFECKQSFEIKSGKPGISNGQPYASVSSRWLLAVGF